MAQIIVSSLRTADVTFPSGGSIGFRLGFHMDSYNLPKEMSVLGIGIHTVIKMESPVSQYAPNQYEERISPSLTIFINSLYENGNKIHHKLDITADGNVLLQSWEKTTASGSDIRK